jgi:hypothetical protein
MRFINDTGIQVKFCIYKTSDPSDFVPCEGGAVFINPKSDTDWYPAPGEHQENFDVRVFKPALLDEPLGRVAAVNRGATVKIDQTGNDFRVQLYNTLRYHNIEIPYPALVASPNSLDELVQHMSEAAARKLKVRAVGGGYSFSDVAHTGDAFLYTHNMGRVLPFDREILKPGVSAENFVQGRGRDHGRKVEQSALGRGQGAH